MLKRLLNLDARWYVIFAILLMAVFKIREAGVMVISHVAGICAVACITDAAILFLKNRRPVFPLSGLVTGLIISAVLAPGRLFYVVALAAILSMHIIRFSGRHIFNPAAFGLFVATVFLRQPLTWWLGTNLALVIPLGILLVLKVRKTSLAASFAAALFLLSIIYSLFKHQPLFAYLGLFNFFFILFMLIEPKTSALFVKGKLISGPLGALFVVLALCFFPAYDFLILGLVGANIANIFLRKAG